MRIATALFTLVSLLTVTRIASAGSATSTDEARHMAGHAQYEMRMPAMPAMPAPAMLPSVPSSTDDFRALSRARQTMARPALAPAATPASMRVTSTDEARAAAGHGRYTPAPATMAVAPGAMDGSVSNRSAAMR
jgi:hypothetical protein